MEMSLVIRKQAKKIPQYWWESNSVRIEEVGSGEVSSKIEISRTETPKSKEVARDTSSWAYRAC